MVLRPWSQSVRHVPRGHPVTCARSASMLQLAPASTVAWSTFTKAKTRMGRGWIMWGVAAVVVLWVAAGIYIVKPWEKALVFRFGESIGIPVQPGIHYHIPWPVERVEIEKVDNPIREPGDE